MENAVYLYLYFFEAFILWHYSTSLFSKKRSSLCTTLSLTICYLVLWLLSFLKNPYLNLSMFFSDYFFIYHIELFYSLDSGTFPLRCTNTVHGSCRIAGCFYLFTFCPRLLANLVSCSQPAISRNTMQNRLPSIFTSADTPSTEKQGCPTS